MSIGTEIGNWEIISACKRHGIMPSDHWDVVTLVQQGKVSNTQFGRRLRLTRYRVCMADIMGIITSHAKHIAV